MDKPRKAVDRNQNGRSPVHNIALTASCRPRLVIPVFQEFIFGAQKQKKLTGTWFWRGSQEFLFFAYITGIFHRNSCGTGIPAFTTDSSGFLRIPVPAKRCLALASD
jgi:hypothetical protein